jgi:hypothetical protein
MPPRPPVPHLRLLLSPIAADDGRVCDRLGGDPNAWAEDDAGAWPICGICEKPLQFVVQLLGEDAGGRARLGSGVSALQIFACHNGGDCGFYEARSKAQHVALRHGALLRRTVQRPGGRTSSVVDDPLREGQAIAYADGADDIEALGDPDSDRGEAAFSAGFCDKLYGVPVAANEPDALTCTTCARPLAFLGQILSADDWFIYYLQRCEDGHELTFHAHRA